MGMTPLEGVPMGTRSGDVDPALFGHLQRTLGWAIEKTTDVLNKESGLLGLSGLSNDVRTLLEAESKGHERARLALEVFVYRIAKAAAALTAPLGRLDALVFTGGIGENAASVRARVVGLLGALGLALDADANAAHGRRTGGRITRAGAGPQALVVPTDEEGMIATDTAALIG
jgi:acetate kinase